MSPRGVEGHLRHLDHDGRGRGRLFDLFLELFVEISSQKLKFKLFAAGNPIVHRQAKSGTRARRVRFRAIGKHERGILLACMEAWREGNLDAGIFQALQKTCK